LLCAQVVLAALHSVPALAKGGHGAGHGGGHCGHAGHGSGHASTYHSATSLHGAPTPTWFAQPQPVNPDQVWQCGTQLVVLGETPAMVQRSCGPPATAQQVVYQAATGEQVIDVWSYQPVGAAVRVLKFEDGALVSLRAVGPS
jgi:Protein of unknown function (DUF2845)